MREASGLRAASAPLWWRWQPVSPNRTAALKPPAVQDAGANHGAAGKSARSWTAPPIHRGRFDRPREMDNGRNLVFSLATPQRKAAEDYRTPRRFAMSGAAGNSARFWTAPVLWRFDHASEMDDGRNLAPASPRSREKR